MLFHIVIRIWKALASLIEIQRDGSMTGGTGPRGLRRRVRAGLSRRAFFVVTQKPKEDVV